LEGNKKKTMFYKFLEILETKLKTEKNKKFIFFYSNSIDSYVTILYLELFLTKKNFKFDGVCTILKEIEEEEEVINSINKFKVKKKKI
jgi:hypothetical protein